MRVVADTNTVVSGMFWRGAPRRVLDAAHTGRIELFTTRALLTELENVLKRDKFARQIRRVGRGPGQLVLEYVSFTTLVKPAVIAPVILADPDDDQVLACALAARAEAIVSGDSHLLNLREYGGIPILTATKLLARILG